MATLNSIITRGFDLVLAPFGGSAWAGLIFISLITGAVLLMVFRYTSNQRGIRATKDQIISHLLEVLLYRDDVRVVLRAQARLARDNLRYLGYALVPLAFMLIPVGLLLVQTDLRFGHRPLKKGEKAIVAVKVAPGVNLDELALSASPGIEVETLPLRIPALDEVDWRVKAVAAGKQELRIGLGAEEIVKDIMVGPSGGRISGARVAGSLWAQFLHPGEPPIPRDAGAKSITVSYPSAHMELLGWRLHWVWPWLLISMAFGYALKGPLRVQV
jgi:hypothetical protein